MVEPLPAFSHLYVEHDIAAHPRASALCRRFPRSQIIPVKHYKEIFNRPRQHFRVQKQSQKLVLAKRRDGFLYPGAPVTPSFSHAHFYYNTLAMNCLFDCSYCYLQGLYPSAHLVLFINVEDYFDATEQHLRASKDIYLCISYDTDLLALESFLPYTELWHQFAAAQSGLTIELRTKSSNIAPLRKLSPSPRFILAWTLSPHDVIRSYEHGTPGLAARLRAAREAQDLGWRVRVCIDPILMVTDWRDQYGAVIREICEVLDCEKIHDVSLGTLRLPREHLKRMRALPVRNAELIEALEPRQRIFAYKAQDAGELTQFVRNEFERYLDSGKIHEFNIQDALESHAT